MLKFARYFYKNYPAFVSSLEKANADFNATADLLDDLSCKGEIFVINPSLPVNLTIFDGDMDKLGDLYFLGFSDMQNNLDNLRNYLEKYFFHIYATIKENIFSFCKKSLQFSPLITKSQNVTLSGNVLLSKDKLI